MVIPGPVFAKGSIQDRLVGWYGTGAPFVIPAQAGIQRGRVGRGNVARGLVPRSGRGWAVVYPRPSAIPAKCRPYTSRHSAANAPELDSSPPQADRSDLGRLRCVAAVAWSPSGRWRAWRVRLNGSGSRGDGYPRQGTFRLTPSRCRRPGERRPPFVIPAQAGIQRGRVGLWRCAMLPACGAARQWTLLARHRPILIPLMWPSQVHNRFPCRAWTLPASGGLESTHRSPATTHQPPNRALPASQHKPPVGATRESTRGEVAALPRRPHAGAS